jgi:hypothetical protein
MYRPKPFVVDCPLECNVAIDNKHVLQLAVCVAGRAEVGRVTKAIGQKRRLNTSWAQLDKLFEMEMKTIQRSVPFSLGDRLLGAKHLDFRDPGDGELAALQTRNHCGRSRHHTAAVLY